MPGVYISYPFCAQKCTYCNFASGVFPKDLERRYLDALGSEIAQTNWPAAFNGATPETIYLGGGTPSQMDPDALAILLAPITKRPSDGFKREVRGASLGNQREARGASLGNQCEATIEVAPGNITPEKAASWSRAGINRASLGVQSFVQEELAQTGRKHTAEIVEREIGILRDAGIDAISIDLIAGLPGQTRESWNASLDWLERLAVPHASVYMLEVDEDSRLGKEVLSLNRGAGAPTPPANALNARYGAATVPSDDLIAEFYETAVDRLSRIGLARYEISNFARPGFESRHNLKYWRREAYLGFGSDAHSFDGTSRWQNAESPSEYVERIESGQPPITERTVADPLGEPFFLGLRLTEGIPASASLASPFAGAIDQFLRDGLLEYSPDRSRIRLTPRGILLSNEVFAEFLGEGDAREGDRLLCPKAITSPDE